MPTGGRISSQRPWKNYFGCLDTIYRPKRVSDTRKLYLKKKAIEEVTSMHQKRCYIGRIFQVQKSSGGWGPVLDLSRLN